MRRTAIAADGPAMPAATLPAPSGLRGLVMAFLHGRFGGADDIPDLRPPASPETGKQEPRNGRLKLCLAGSGGGHLRQLLDMEPFWKDHDRFFVTEDTAFGRSIGALHDTAYVPHFALGQARLGSPFRMLAEALHSLLRSFAIIARRRPDLVVTTGAGSMLFIAMWARIFGARIILIDSFARFLEPSTFARVMGPMAHVRIAQAQAVAQTWNTPWFFDPFRVLDTPRPAKQKLIFATVGATLPFDRLVETVIDARRDGLFDEELVVQTGDTLLHFDAGEGVRIVKDLPFGEVNQILERADIVVSHGGTGSIITALQHHCRLIVVPRRFALGEHYDDHQWEIARNFKQRGLIEVVDEDCDFATALAAVRNLEPRPATMDPRELNAFLADQAAMMTGVAA